MVVSGEFRQIEPFMSLEMALLLKILSKGHYLESHISILILLFKFGQRPNKVSISLQGKSSTCSGLQPFVINLRSVVPDAS
jgi:hypothetical protein